MRLSLSIILAILFWVGNALATGTVAGHVKTLNGQVQVQRGAIYTPASLGQPLFIEDIIATGQNSTVGIMLEDDTLVSLGPGSRLELKDFAFDPSTETFGMALRLLKGSFAYMSGVIGRMAPEKVSVETPDAVISTHGTRFLVKVEERQ